MLTQSGQWNCSRLVVPPPHPSKSTEDREQWSEKQPEVLLLREMGGGENRLGGWRELQWGHPKALVLIRVVLATCCVTLGKSLPSLGVWMVAEVSLHSSI